MRLFSLLISFCFAFVFPYDAGAQDSLIVSWQTEIKNNNNKEAEIKLTASIKKGWHIYAANVADELKGITVTIDDSAVKAASPLISAAFENIADPVFDGKLMQVTKSAVVVVQKITAAVSLPAKLRLLVGYETSDGAQFIPEEQTINLVLDEQAVAANPNRILVPAIDIKAPLNPAGAAAQPDTKSLFSVFGLGFIGGLLALFLPCFFPMIPLTVSFFTKRAHSRQQGIRNAFLYGFFIFAIYVVITIPFHFAEQLKPEIFNNISTNVYLNIFFFAVFIFFAGSFFGYYDLTLPASFSGSADRKSGVSNIAGIFFMALTLTLVSFSCTGPVIGTLLAGTLSGDGGAMRLSVGMGGFGLALALPFALFALFPNLLHSLPKSGGWLNTVKVVLGFLELAFAFKFLSNADLVMHWGLLKREIFIGIWIIIGIGLTLYLFGKIRFPHDSPVKKLHPLRIALAFLSAFFTIYLVPGVTKTSWRNLTLISGFPPPLYYSIYPQKSDCILGLNCTNDYEEGLKRARAENKPILLDFTGYACVNCRRMEENVWSDASVNQLMTEKFIVVSLYVDDKKKLPSAQQFTYTTKEGATRDIRTVGDKWATFQTENFASNAQPLYAVINTKEQLLTHPVAYTPNVNEYLQWLMEGVKTFERDKVKIQN